MSNFYPQKTIDEVNSRLDIRKLMQTIDYRFEKYQENPKTAKGFCPIHREGLFRNLVIDQEARTFRCQYTQCVGSKGGSLVSLFSQAREIDIDSAVRAIVRDQEIEIKLPVNRKIVEQRLETANNELEAGHQEVAEAQYLEILEMDTNCADAHHGLLKIHEARGEMENRAEKLVIVCRLKIDAGEAADIPDLIREWSEIDSDSPEARFACAELLYANSDAESAVMEFMGGGDACEGKGDLEAAVHAYRRAAAISADKNIDIIDVTPHVVRVLTQLDRADEAVNYLHNLAENAATAGNLDSATEFCIMAIEVNPERADSHRRFLESAAIISPTPIISHHVIQSAHFLRDNDEHDFAIHSLENYLRTAPDDENALLSLINEYNNYGRAQDALELEARLAALMYEQGRKEEAREIVDRVLIWQPQHIAMLHVLIHIQEHENETEDGRESRRRLVRAFLAQKKYREGLDYIDALSPTESASEDMLESRAAALEGLAVEGDAEAAEQAVEALSELGIKCMEATNGRRAVSYLQRAVELQENPPVELLFKLADAYLRMKNSPRVRDTVINACETLAGRDRLDEAILEAERYSNLIPKDSDLARYLVELYLRFDDKPAAVARLRRLGEDLIKQDRHAEAEEVMEQANDLEPQNLDNLTRQLKSYRDSGNAEKVQQALLRLATFHEQKENFTQAASALSEYLQSDQDSIPVIQRLISANDKLEDQAAARQWRLQLARVYRASLDMDREARALRDVLARFPDDEEALHMLMNTEFNRKDMQSGVTIARRLATLQQEAGKAEVARKTLMKAVERVPENLSLNREIFDYHREASQPNQALTWGRKVIAILRASSKNAEAAIVFEQMVALDPDNLALKQEQLSFLEEVGRDTDVAEKRLTLANIYREQERFRDAEAMLVAVIDIDSRNLLPRQQLADLHLHLGENAKAESQLLRIAGIHHLEGDSEASIKVLRQVMKMNPANFDARRQLTQVYRAEGNTTEALEELLALADSYRSQQMEIEALAAEREASEIDPGNLDLIRRLAESLKAAGRVAPAAEQLEQIVATQTAAKNFDDALQVLGEILELDPARLSARKARSEILAELGRNDEAMEELKTLANMALEAKTAEPGLTAKSSAESRATLQLVPEYTFDQFIVGANNDFAHATTLAIARSPAKAYNPLFLYANVGLGKTHLCNAIANYLMEHDPKAGIIYTNSEDFTDELVEAIQNNNVQQFRTRYRSLDLLIVDDVQFLTGKERAQEEFFHIFNSLFQAKRQIVITSDRPPSEIAHLEGRLRSRFGAGVIVDIDSPDLETRLAILNREIEENQLNFDPWTARLIAEKIDTNVRDLKGALNQVVAMRDLRRKTVTKESVNQMLDTLYPAAVV